MQEHRRRRNPGKFIFYLMRVVAGIFIAAVALVILVFVDCGAASTVREGAIVDDVSIFPDQAEYNKFGEPRVRAKPRVVVTVIAKSGETVRVSDMSGKIPPYWRGDTVTVEYRRGFISNYSGNIVDWEDKRHSR